MALEGVVVPGEHQLLASKAGYVPATERVVVSAGERMEVALALRLPERPVTERYMPAWVPWASLAAGAAALGAGRYLDGRADDRAARFDEAFHGECPRGCDIAAFPALDRQLADAEAARRAALGLYITGGVVVAVSAALLYINRERVVRRAEPGSAVSVAPMLGARAAGLTARARPFVPGQRLRCAAAGADPACAYRHSLHAS